jgi:GntP family gluconate:H+ symporter
MNYLLTLSLVIVSIIGIIILTSKIKLNSFVALLLVSLFLAFLTLPAHTIVAHIKEGFGSTMGAIGFLVILGAIIGITLDKTGGMISIANYILSKTGNRNAPAALGITGFIAGMPIFCDSGYIIMNGLAKSFSAKAKIAMPFMATVLATSLYSVHCLIPTHPGALAGAEIMNTNIGNLIILGIVFAIPGAVAAYFWSKYMTKEKNYPVADDIKVEDKFAQQELPPVFLSLIPIIVPLALIIIGSLLNLLDPKTDNLFIQIFRTVGEPVFALFIGAFLSMFLIKKRNTVMLNEIFSEAIEKAGPILIVTAAGGMFGMIIKATGIGEETGKMLAGTGLGLVAPFLIALFLKTAQGSSTVAIITTASFVTPMLAMLGLDSESGRLFAMLSISSGSMIFSHANDSYFWVVSKFSDITVDTTLKVYSSSTFVMGIVVFVCVWITSIFVL